MLRVNQEYLELFGHSNFSSNSLRWEQVLQPKYRQAIWEAVYEAIESKDVSRCIYLREYPDRTPQWVDFHLKYICQTGSNHILFGFFSNITAEMQAKEKLKNLEEKYSYVVECAKRDNLTQVFNRTETEKQIDYYLNLQSDAVHGFLMLDLDNFKEINDTHGHIVGDMVLQEIAHILLSFFRTRDIVGRFGGDEFVVFIPTVQNAQLVLEKACELCSFILQKNLTDKQIRTSISVGACISDSSSSFVELYKKADCALYQAKSVGKAQAKLYHDKDMRCHYEQ